MAAPLLLPISVLALGSAGQPAAPAVQPPVPGLYRGTTAQKRDVTIRVRRGGRRASWRIRYSGRCDDGVPIRGGFRSGDGTPLLELGRDGTFRASGSETAPFQGGGAGTARYELSGRLGPEGGSGTWRIDVAPPGASGASASCTSGPVRWGATRG
jgi:hypothetical protein